MAKTQENNTILNGKYRVVGVVPGEFSYEGQIFNHLTLTEGQAEYLALRGQGFLEKVEDKK